MIGLVVFTVRAFWKGKERTWSSGGERESAREREHAQRVTGNEEGPGELENRSRRMGKRKTIFSHCGGREIKVLLRGGDNV